MPFFNLGVELGTRLGGKGLGLGWRGEVATDQVPARPHPLRAVCRIIEPWRHALGIHTRAHVRTCMHTGTRGTRMHAHNSDRLGKGLYLNSKSADKGPFFFHRGAGLRRHPPLCGTWRVRGTNRDTRVLPAKTSYGHNPYHAIHNRGSFPDNGWRVWAVI